MKILTIIRSALLLCFILTSQAFAGGIAVIVHPSSTLKDVSVGEIKHLFLSKTSSIKGVKLSPIAQSTSQSIRVIFDEDALGKNPSKSKAYWSRMIFTASGTPPPELESSSAVIEWVSKHPDAIGYIELGSLKDKVKLLLEI